MTPEQQKLLSETHDLAQENYRILKSIQRSNRMSTVFRVIYWVFIIGTSIGAFWLIQPYIDSLKGSVGNIQSLYQ